MTRGGNLTLIVILLILWFVGIFLAGYFGYEHFDKHKKSETNLILFALGVILAIGTFIGIIVLFIKRSRLPKQTKASDITGDMGKEMAGYNLPPGYPPGYENMPLMQGYPAQAGYGQGFAGAQGYPSQAGYGQGFAGAQGYPSQASYPGPNPYLAQQYSI
jgi:hypothetical protein